MKLHLPKLLLTAVLAACSAAQSYAASLAPTDAATSTSGDLLWAYSSSTEGKYTDNLPEGASMGSNQFIENEDGSITATDYHHAQINNINSTSTAGFTVSFDLLAQDTANWENVLAVGTNENQQEAQLQKSSDGRLMIYAANFGGGTTPTTGEYSLGQLNSLVGSTITLTFDGSTLTGYVDGLRVTSLTYTFAEGATKYSGLSDVAFAHSSAQGGRWGNSTYDNIGVWDSAMTAVEVAAQAGYYVLNLSGTVDSNEAVLQHAHQDATFSDVDSNSLLAIFGTTSNDSLNLSESLTVNTLAACGDTTIQVLDGATLSAGTFKLDSTVDITVQKEGVIDLSSVSLPDDATSAHNKGITSLINKTSGEGTVKLAGSSYINTGANKTQLTFDTNYVIGSDSNAYFSLNSHWNTGSWITHTVTENGSITVGNGAGRFEVLSGQKLLIEGGTVTVGTLAVGHSSTEGVYSGAVEMTSGQLTTGTIYVQNKGADNWKNEVKLTGGTLKITGTEALTYATEARTTAIIGGSGDSTLILQTGDNNWSLSKGSTAGSTLEIGNITVDVANTKMITINGGLLSGSVVNNATTQGAGLTLSGNFSLTEDTFERYASTNGFVLHNIITVDNFTGDGNYVFSDNMTIEGIAFSSFTKDGSVYKFNADTTGTIYHVADAPFTIDGSETNAAKDATGYHVYEGQTLTVAAAQSESMTTDVILSTTTGNGTINLTTTATIGNGVKPEFEGLLKVSTGGVLQIGTSGYENAASPGNDGSTSAWTADLSNLSGIELAGGKMRFRGGNINLGNITVSAASELNIFDQSRPDSNSEINQARIGTLALNAALNMTTKWKSNTKISALTGTGPLTLAASNEERKVYLDNVNGYSGTITANGSPTTLTIGNDSTINTDLKLVINDGQLIIDGNNDNKETALEAQKMGTALTMGTATMKITDGSYNFAGGLTIIGGKTATIINNWDKHQFVAGLTSESEATIDWRRGAQAWAGGSGNYRAMVLTAKGDFTGTINLINENGTNNEDGAKNYNYNHAIVVTSAATGALEKTVVNFGAAGSNYGSTLAFTDTVGGTGGTMLDGSVAGLSGDCGRVYAKALTINVAKGGDYTYGGSIESDSLTKSGEGKQTLTQSYGGIVNVTGGELAVSGEHALTGSELNITNGKVTATIINDNVNKTVISHNTKVNIGTGGTLVLSGHDMVGWFNSNAPSIILGSADTTKKAVLDIQDTDSCTFGSAVTMNGNSEIKGSKINTHDVTLTVSGTGNSITADIMQIRKDLSIDVGQSAELTINSKLANRDTDPGNITKSGLGKLVVTNSESTWTGTLNVTAGILELREAATLNSVEMSANTSLISGNGKIKSLTLESGSELQAASAVTMADESSLSLGIGLTLNGDLLNSIKSLTGDKTVDLFTNVGTLTLGDDVFTKGTDVLDATSGIDLSKYFTLADAQTPAVLSDEQLSSGYYLGFDAEGTLYAGVIPEPTTATLSLLALAALAARRRRK